MSREYLGKWYSRLFNEGNNAEGNCDNAVKIMGFSMWMFNMVANCGVLCGIGTDDPTWNQLTIAEGLDEKTTKSLLIRMVTCMNLQYLV